MAVSSVDIDAIRSYARGMTHFSSLPVNNLSTPMWVATVPMEQFAQMADIANEARVGVEGATQRHLHSEHSYRLARYIQKAAVDAALKAALRTATLKPTC